LFNILYIALLYLDRSRALEFFPGLVSKASAFIYLPVFSSIRIGGFRIFACCIMVCVGVSAEQVSLGSINQSINNTFNRHNA
jgi:hypothetical protein